MFLLRRQNTLQTQVDVLPMQETTVKDMHPLSAYPNMRVLGVLDPIQANFGQ